LGSLLRLASISEARAALEMFGMSHSSDGKIVAVSNAEHVSYPKKFFNVYEGLEVLDL